MREGERIGNTPSHYHLQKPNANQSLESVRRREIVMFVSNTSGGSSHGRRISESVLVRVRIRWKFLMKGKHFWSVWVSVTGWEICRMLVMDEFRRKNKDMLTKVIGKPLPGHTIRWRMLLQLFRVSSRSGNLWPMIGIDWFHNYCFCGAVEVKSTKRDEGKLGQREGEENVLKMFL